MPYSGINDEKLPDRIKKLSESKRKTWVGAWNGTYDDCRQEGKSQEECEGLAFAVANGAIKRVVRFIYRANL